MGEGRERREGEEVWWRERERWEAKKRRREVSAVEEGSGQGFQKFVFSALLP